MKYKTKISLECSYGLGQPWELRETVVEYDYWLTFRELYNIAITKIGGDYVTYGVMEAVEEMNER